MRRTERLFAIIQILRSKRRPVTGQDLATELRKDFRHFRTDRITAITRLSTRFPEHPNALRRRWEAQRDACRPRFTAKPQPTGDSKRR